MRFSKYLNSASYRMLGTVIIAIGLGIIILAIINPPLLLQITLGFIGLGFISMGLFQLKRSMEDYSYKKSFNQLIAKLDEIQLELQEDKEAKKRGATVAEIISSGLKYYADQKNKAKKDE